MLEDAVAEAVSRHIRTGAADGQWRGRPVVPGLFVAHIERFAGGIGDRIVVPRREAEEARVFAPRVRHPGFGHDRSELVVGKHVDPWRRRCLAGLQPDHILTTVFREAAESVEEQQLIRGDRCSAKRDRRRFRARQARRRKQTQCVELRSTRIDTAPSRDLLGQRTAPIADDHARHRLQQHAILIRNLLGAADENAAGLVHQLGLDACRNQTDDLFLQQRPISGAVFIPDHQVDDQPLHPPVRVCLDQLPYEVDVFRVTDLHQHNRQIAGDRVAP